MDIEESIWAPKYGLKGNVDATLLVAREAPPPSARAQPGGVQQFGQRPAAVSSQTALAPFEFKTGRPHMSHRAQVCGDQFTEQSHWSRPTPHHGLCKTTSH